MLHKITLLGKNELELYGSEYVSVATQSVATHTICHTKYRFIFACPVVPEKMQKTRNNHILKPISSQMSAQSAKFDGDTREEFNTP